MVSKSVISQIIVLMMENRSFDHLLGWLKTDKLVQINGVTEGMKVPRDPNDSSKGEVPVSRGGYDVSPDDPRHGFDDIAIQLAGNNMNGFVYDSIINNLTEENPVSMFDYTSAPIINTLGMEYAIFDSWFCSIPGPTDPNRQFAMSGTSDGTITNFNGTLYTQQSYFDYLRENGHTFAGYYQDDLWALGYFEDLLKPINFQHVKQLEPNFYDDVEAGTLPEFTWLQPRSSAHVGKLPTWQHPDASVQEGERLIKDVYEALRASPKWNETLFIITYDEHGGFYDHVVPPHGDGVVPNPDGKSAPNGYNFNSLGVRIPTVAISPWIPKGTIISTNTFPNERPTGTSAFESTSLLATSNILLGLNNATTLSSRMSWANTFSGLFSPEFSGLTEPRTDCIDTLPALPLRGSMEYEAQRAKPLNGPMLGQINYFCKINYAELHAEGSCPGLPTALAKELQALVLADEIPERFNAFNQGAASDWLAINQAAFISRIGRS